ncbi:PEP-CTERM sorting domain-containing protein [Thalassomonas actiniarum]|uniref:PEP-CTERM sorting domain-containing protein n=1 Tax=Thalassomonas actiniarum TaxID=485447 RepID=A0AAE9YR55_9GAMM|nr:PEP-CTERM sorting domain-containing protein [Thalassomonas actiniarum]WDD98774.1 PEP-CTERM sorting domain-containing protein [Thalassomonas actiniarum]
MLRILILIMSFIVTHANAALLYTDFSDLEEGFHGATLNDNGIIFSDVKEVAGERYPTHWAIDEIDPSALPGEGTVPGIKQLTFGGYSSGVTSGSGSSFGSANIDFEAENAHSATVNIYDTGNTVFWAWSNILTLEALFNDSVVASSFISFDDNQGLQRVQSLSVSGVNFDSLRLVASGAEVQQSVFISIDSVSIETGTLTVPEPNSIVLFSVLALVAFRRKFINS